MIDITKLTSSTVSRPHCDLHVLSNKDGGSILQSDARHEEAGILKISSIF